jgi:type IV pilus assembly protein PilX
MRTPPVLPRRRLPARAAPAQRGVIMLVTLLALVIMLVGAVALVRSFNSSLFMAGNLAFKRDLVNQAERASAVVLARLDTGGLNTRAARAASSVALNYSAAMLPTNDQGIPLALLSGVTFATVASAANDIVVAGQGVTVRYVVDRLCNAVGNEVTLGTANCTVGPTPDARGGSASDINVATLQPQVLYRVSIRVDGPRNTQAFFQTTIAL